MIESLNEKISVDCDLNLTFYETDKLSETAEIIKTLFPLSKIAVLSTLDTDLRFISEFKYALMKQGIKPIFIFLKDAPLLDVNAVSDLFLMAEDVRGIIVINKSLCKVAEYFSYVRKTTCFYFLYDGLSSDLLFGHLCLKNGARIDVIKKDFERKIILPKTFITNFTKKEALAHFTVMLLSLVDISVKNAMRKIDSQTAINKILKKIETRVNDVCFDAESGDYALNAVLDVQTDFLAFGKDATLNSLSALSFLMGKDCAVYYPMRAACSILDVYKTDFCSKCDFTFPNYAERAKLVSYYGGIDCGECIKAIKSQAEIFSALKESDFEYSYSVAEEVKRIYGKILNFYKSKKIKQTPDELILLAGDTPLGVNGVSLIREYSVNERL